jgi:hypothetical protein
MTETGVDPQPGDENPTHRTRGVVYRRITLLMQGIMCLELIAAAWQQQWFNAFLVICVLFLTMIPAQVAKRFRVYIPPAFQAAAVMLIFSSLFLGIIERFFFLFWWWDKLMHLSTAFLLGIVGFLLVYVLNQHRRVELHMTPSFVALFSFVFAMAMGGLWEIFEYAADHVLPLGLQARGLPDTIWDLVVDAIGAAITAVMGYFYLKSPRAHFLERFIGDFVEGNPGLFRGGGAGDEEGEDAADGEIRAEGRG